MFYAYKHFFSVPSFAIRVNKTVVQIDSWRVSENSSIWVTQTMILQKFDTLEKYWEVKAIVKNSSPWKNILSHPSEWCR